METARYVIALIAVALFPPSIIHWILVHSLTRVWRRVGLVWTYAITISVFTVGHESLTILSLLQWVWFGYYEVSMGV